MADQNHIPALPAPISTRAVSRNLRRSICINREAIAMREDTASIRIRNKPPSPSRTTSGSSNAGAGEFWALWRYASPAR